ncbi:MAG: hypothetical protein DI606_09420 [Sphingobium sp.]|uniref:histidine phosphatase family protein n=1 Tax=Sphingobium sp. TaxID=1912891 RepID=UPI000DB6428F|nr:histidine phosphatase family protein [Sphingobium sp.]PZU12386.1 MAG: hypothetical protein DI606_09420 [Sphingobium sp.]
MQLILVRHGIPDNAHSRSVSNPALSEQGMSEARQTCARLALEPIDAIYSSPLLRAVQTGQPLADHLQMPIHELAEIGEVDNGVDVYVSPEAIRAAGEWDQFLRDPIRYYGHDEGEFKSRVMAGFERILSEASGRRIAVFTHGFPINILLSHVLKLPRITHFTPRNGSISRLAGKSLNALQILSVNETSHFELEKAR